MSDFLALRAGQNFIISPFSLTLCLAFIPHYTPDWLPRRRSLAPKHLRVLANWIGCPSPQLLSLRKHPLLAAHLALLLASDLIAVNRTAVHLTLRVTSWLHQPPMQQIEALLRVLGDEAYWSDSIQELSLQKTITIDYTAYLVQQLSRQQDMPPAPAKPVTLLAADEAHWLLALSSRQSAWLLFDLLQLGCWQPGQQLRLTPLSIAMAATRGYGFEHIRWLLETALDKPLKPEQISQLQRWNRRAQAYQMQGNLLCTAHPDDLAAVYAQRRFRPFLLQQISPRHVFVQPELLPKLRRWLSRRGYPLNRIEQPAGDMVTSPDLDSKTHWLGLRLLIDLQQVMPLPLPAPTEQLFRLEKSMEAATVADLSRLAQTIRRRLADTIAGRDAFFPARQCPTPQALAQLDQAIVHGQTVVLFYRANGQVTARRHVVEPLRLERREQLAYLTAYSYLAEAELTFRLDRLEAIEFK